MISCRGVGLTLGPILKAASIAALREIIEATRIDTDPVEGDIVDAMRASRFWILTREAGRNPTPLQKDIAELEELGELIG